MSQSKNKFKKKTDGNHTMNNSITSTFDFFFKFFNLIYKHRYVNEKKNRFFAHKRSTDVLLQHLFTTSFAFVSFVAYLPTQIRTHQQPIHDYTLSMVCTVLR